MSRATERACGAWRAVVLGAVITMVLAMGGCGAGVRALDPHDLTLPVETRAWIAGAEDGVIVARAKLDVARGQLREAEQWASRFDEALAGLRDPFRALARARHALARAALRDAELGVELAVAKRTLVYAESAVRHDRARYDLPPLRAEVDTLRERKREAARDVTQRRLEEAAATEELWAAYAQFAASGGDTTAFWLVGLD